MAMLEADWTNLNAQKIFEWTHVFHLKVTLKVGFEPTYTSKVITSDDKQGESHQK